ncbi:hypothetical protein OEZ86_002576 [Tetradesmus obliquus]|uniref:protein disulfide-isomerase n=1 Tax=Tetradesmus obliquus TaxID=3088 RepID=A0A383V4B9_TETOB|nr:hypothetical protein OEZ86_002537 [Tetradesmus obliquus]WIA31665.1 hypothetical protein OEZ86_002545 [Tetradesmus obliquus]WIA31676.1 hypothetical protein OEZ86_002556 [Tetradesmus obliquus]WIA31689.1 hypothetical protein OEZ86_002568 [Tetradesmus obliquus]WIA31698.1 hypothetical protein OEZ86_002576 [Tetradesmus obliquus]|eukprot:jgi/Sobl393_1/11032/SZX59931.1
MKLLVVAALAALVAVVSASGDPTESLPGVQDLTPDNFDKFVNGAKHALVEFYAPWCGHCKHLVPEYKKLGEAIAKDPSLKNRVVIAKVNADSHRSLGERFGVSGFPTIKWFSRGKPVTTDAAEAYNKGRSLDAFLEFIKEKLDADKGFARVEALDKLAQAFVAEGADKDKVAADVKAAAAKVDKEQAANAKLYVEAIEKALARGVEYFEKEQGRLQRMIDSGSVAAGKVDSFAAKVSVLSAFTEKPEAAAAAKSDADEDDEEL